MLMQLAIKAALSGIPYVLELQIAFFMLLQLTIIKAALAGGSLCAVGAGSLFYFEVG